VLSRIPGAGEFVARARRSVQDRIENSGEHNVKKPTANFKRCWILSTLLLSAFTFIGRRAIASPPEKTTEKEELLVLPGEVGRQFADGYPMDADDVLFSFRLYLDEKVHAPQRDLLVFDGKPISLQKVDSHTIVFQLPKPYGVMERMFDGWAILPRHLLEKPYEEGKIAQVGALTTPPNQWAGLGPFRLKEYVAGQRLVLERNPNY